jgi:hypothetical protein
MQTQRGREPDYTASKFGDDSLFRYNADGHCASVPVGQRLSVFPQELLIILLRPIKESGISNIRLGVVYKAKHEVCTQVVAFSLPGSGCS